MKGVQATKGHLSSNGGLRGHSVDADTFPLIVVGQHCPKRGQVWRVRLADGQYTYKLHETAHSAQVDAKYLKSGFLSTMTELEYAKAGGYLTAPDSYYYILSDEAQQAANEYIPAWFTGTKFLQPWH